uniref:VQ domain-containing protein n=1 Tax=Leersia perrieri TaxID=77586 RepID=A0A0D9VEC0_9ORYZ
MESIEKGEKLLDRDIKQGVDHFVTSDAAGFKSLVQRLTGNNDAVDDDGWRVAGGTSATASVGGRDDLLYETCDLAEN